MPLSTQNIHHFRLYPQTILNLYTSDLQQDDAALTNAHRQYLLFICNVIEANQTLAAPQAVWHTATADLNNELTAELASMLTNPAVFQDADLLATDFPEVRFTVLSQLVVLLFQAQRASPAERNRARQALSQFYAALPQHVIPREIQQPRAENWLGVDINRDNFARQFVRLAPLAFAFIGIGFYQAIVPLFNHDVIQMQRDLMKAMQNMQQAHDEAQLQALHLQSAQYIADIKRAHLLIFICTFQAFAWVILVATYHPAFQMNASNRRLTTRPRLASWPVELDANLAEAAGDHNRHEMR